MKYLAIVLILILVGSVGSSFGFEPTYVNYFSNPEFQVYKIQEKYYEFFIPYKISNAKLESMIIDCKSLALLVYLNGDNAYGEFTINIPRKLIDTQKLSEDRNDDFIILVNEVEADYQEISDSDFRTLEITLPPSSNIIEIIASNVGQFPEPIPCGVTDSEDSPYYRILSPLKQIKSGIKVENVTCQNNLQLIFKATNGYPACVKASSVSKLLARGWGYDLSATSQPIPKDLTDMDK
jgi:hypothetical protein